MSCMRGTDTYNAQPLHDDVIKWKHFPRYWPFVRGIHRRPVNSPHKGPVTRSFDVFFDLRPINAWVNNSKAGDLRRNHAHYDVTVMISKLKPFVTTVICHNTITIIKTLQLWQVRIFFSNTNLRYYSIYFVYTMSCVYSCTDNTVTHVNTVTAMWPL